MATKGMPKHRYVETDLGPELIEAEETASDRRKTIAALTLLWQNRQILFRRTAIGLAVCAVIAFLIPSRYSSTTRLMPPDQTGQGMASMLAALEKVTGDLGGNGASGMWRIFRSRNPSRRASC